MQPTLLALVVVAGLGFTAPPALAAQELGAGAATPEPGESRAVDAAESSGLPVSLERIKRRMAATRETQEGRRGLLNLSYYVDVYARAPAVELLRNFDPDSETVSYGSPTHREMLEAATPREWRPRAISTGNLFGWR